MKNLLSIEALSGPEIDSLVSSAVEMKRHRKHGPHVLKDQTWALMFSKSSTRTRVSFEVGVRELGGFSLFLSAADTQMGRGEPMKDSARVLGRMVDGAIIRTFAQSDLEDFAHYSGLPTINALTDEEHPCQILADLLTIRERLGGWDGKVVCFYGDGACNMARSWIWASERLGFELRIVAPEKFQPDPAVLARLKNGSVIVTDDPHAAAAGADVVYTDVWVSMGTEADGEERLRVMKPFQVNDEIIKRANRNAVVLHCLPAYRGKEITEEVLERNADVIFTQAENRLHAQKAVLAELARG